MLIPSMHSFGNTFSASAYAQSTKERVLSPWYSGKSGVLFGVSIAFTYLFHFDVLARILQFLLLYLAYQFFYLAGMRYVVTDEQLIFLHGVFQRSTDYMELYRVVDYQQNRTFLQQLLGLKTITILSGDRNMNRLDIIGVRETENIVSEIRNRVEYNKRMKCIYEITNRF